MALTSVASERAGNNPPRLLLRPPPAQRRSPRARAPAILALGLCQFGFRTGPGRRSAGMAPALGRPLAGT
jgi:hypothetical protein